MWQRRENNGVKRGALAAPLSFAWFGRARHFAGSVFTLCLLWASRPSCDPGSWRPHRPRRLGRAPHRPRTTPPMSAERRALPVAAPPTRRMQYCLGRLLQWPRPPIPLVLQVRSMGSRRPGPTRGRRRNPLAPLRSRRWPVHKTGARQPPSP
eukprot:scaffold25800_cov24-Tisochrysis_lutea.AAC.1